MQSRANLCMSFKKISTIFSCHLMWVHSRVTSVCSEQMWRQEETDATHGPSEVSWVNYCHSFLSMFYGILRQRTHSLIRMNLMTIYTSKYIQQRVHLIAPHASQVDQYPSLPVLFTHKPPGLQDISRFSVDNIIAKAGLKPKWSVCGNAEADSINSGVLRHNC